MNIYKKITLITLLQLPLFALSLPEAVEQTLASNPQMQKTISDYIAIKNDLDIAESGYRPTLDFNAGIGQEISDKDRADDSVSLTRQESQLVARQNLFEGFGTQSDIQEQEARVNASRYTALQEANSIALRTAEVYLQILRQKKILDLLLTNVKTHERIYKMIKQKTDSGLSRRSDLEQTQGRLALAYSNYVSQLNNYQDSITNFERVFGKTVSAIDLEEQTLTILPSSTQAGLLQLANENSPTLLIQKSNIKSQESLLEKEKSNFYPTVDFELSGEWNENLDGIEGKDQSYQAMLRLKYNIYGGGNDESTRLKNLQLVTSQKESLNEQQRAVLEKLTLAFTAERILGSQINCLKVHTKQTRKTADSYAKEYQLGRRTLLDLLNTELEYNSAQQAVENATFDRLYARYRILEVTGVLPFIFVNSVVERIDAIEPMGLTKAEENTEIELRGEVDEFMNIATICKEI